MTDFFIATAAFVFLTVAGGLFRFLKGPGQYDRMMAAQLIGTGGLAVLLLAGQATGGAGIADLALVLALLAAFASIAFVNAVEFMDPEASEGTGRE